MWKQSINIHEVKELRCKTDLFFGVGAIQKIDSICKQLAADGIDSVLVVASRSAYKKCGAWDVVEPALQKHNISYEVYNGITPNPDNIQVDEAVEVGKKIGAKAVFGIGGGSPIDAAKSAAILLEYTENDCRQLYSYEFTPTKAVPTIAINTTHGTGTEVDRFAVVSIPELGHKPAIAYDCIYPLYAIDDPALMQGLPENQTLFVTIDAINHIVEAATTTVATPFSILLAKETVNLIVEYLPKALADPQDLEARYYLLYASALAGISFDNGMLHLTHALEHPLSAVKPELAHGLGLAMILPSVLKAIYPASGEVLADVFAPMVPGMTGKAEEADSFALAVEKWLFDLGVTSKLNDEGYSEEDIDRLTELAMTTPSLDLLLSLAPVEASKEVVSGIYTESLVPLKDQLAVG
ncbi:MAG: iron-containing alcohol dehydrogenase [Spirochaetota bacterium]